MPVDPLATRRFIESLSTHLEDHLAAWKSALADTRSDITTLLNAMSERIPAQAKPLFPEDIVAMMLEDVLPPPPEPQKVVEKVVERVVEKVMVPGPPSAPDWSLVKGPIAAIESARTQVDVLTRFLTEASAHASRVALLVLRNDRVTGWKAFGFDASGGRDDVVKAIDFASNADPFLATVLKSERPHMAVPPAEDSPFRRALGGRAPARTFVVPMVIRDRVAGLLCADELPDEEGRLNESALEVLTFVTGLAVDLLAARKKIPSPSLTPRGDTVPVFAAPPSAEPARAPQPEPESLHERELQVPRPVPPLPIEPARPVEPPRVVEPPRRPEPAPAGVSASGYEPAPTEPPSGVPPAHPVAPPPLAHPVAPPPPALEPERLSVQTPSSPDFSLGRPAPPRPAQELTDPGARARRKVTDAGEALRALEESATAKKKIETGGIGPDLLFGTIRATIPPAALRVPPAEPRPAPTPTPVPPLTPAGDLTLAFEQIKGSVPPPVPAAPPIPRESSAPRPMPVPTAAASPLEAGLPGMTPLAPPPGFVPRARALRTGDDPQRAFDDARRLARLLVSEIKLYNERKVEEGRVSGDIYERLKDDIERSRQLYNERTPESVRQGGDFFRDEIVRVLADGRADTLGPMP